MKNPKALRFNLGQKLCRLVRVIEALLEQKSEREYHEQLLYEKYDPLILDCLRSYHDKAAPVAEELDTEVESIQTEIDNHYRERVSSLQAELERYCESAAQSIEAFQVKLDADLKRIDDELEVIMEQLAGRPEELDKLFESRRAKSAEAVASARETMKQEVQNHDAEAERRVSELKEKSARELEALRKSNERELQEMVESFSSDKSGKIDAVSKLRTLKTKLANARDLLMGTEANARSVIDSQKAKAKELRDKIEGICRSVIEFEQKRVKQVGDLKDAEEKLRGECQSRLEDAQREKAADSAKMKEAIEKAGQDTNEKIERLGKVLEERKERLKASETDSDGEWRRLLEKNEAEVKRIQKENEEARRKEELGLQQKRKDLEALNETHAKELAAQKQQLEDLKIRLSGELEQQRIKGMKAVDDENELFEREKAKLLEEIEAKKHGSDVSAMKNTETIKKLQQEIEELRATHQADVAAKTKEMEQKEAAMNEEVAKERKQKEEEHSAAKKAKAEEHRVEREALADKLKTERESHERELEKQRQEALAKVQGQFSDRKDQESLAAEYERRISELTRKRDSIEIPKGDAEKFAKLDREINDLEGQRAKVLVEVESQERDLNNEFAARFEEERQRHSEKVKCFSVVDNRDNEKEELRRRIEEARRVAEETQARITGLIQDEVERHKQAMAELEAALEESDQATDADKLKDAIRELGLKNREELERMQAAFSREVEDVKAQKRREKANHAGAMAELAKRTQTLEKEHMGWCADIKAREEDERKKYMSDMARTKAEAQKLMKEEQKKHQDSISALKKETADLSQAIADAKSQFQKTYQEQQNSAQSALDEKERQTRESFEKMKRDWIGMRDFYDERIEVLTNERQKIIDMYEQRPPRPQDAALIEKLETNLKVATTQVQTGVKELVEFKRMFVTQEKEYNRRFGRGPKVGTFNPQ